MFPVIPKTAKIIIFARGLSSVEVKWCELARTAVLGLEAAEEPDVSIEAAAQKLLSMVKLSKDLKSQTQGWPPFLLLHKCQYEGYSVARAEQSTAQL